MAKNYINNADLLAEVILFKSTGVMSENLGKMLLALANNYSSKGNFVGYTWRNDMVSEAVLTCVKYLKNFNPDRSSNVFSYVTQICKNSFKLYIKDQNKHSKIKDICYNTAEDFKRDNEVVYIQKSLNYEDLLNYMSSDTEKWEDLYIKEESVEELVINDDEISNNM
jgi:DNA-directed RNA polymerase specialized sigma subunit